MSDYRTPRPIIDEDLSQSSDEKMDTGSESIRSQDTPNSTLSSDFDDKSIESNVLRLQNPQTEASEVLRLSAPSDPEANDNIRAIKLKTENLTDSFVNKMSNLNLNSPLENRQLSLCNGTNLSPKLENRQNLSNLEYSLNSKHEKHLNCNLENGPNLSPKRESRQKLNSPKFENRYLNSPKVENRPHHLGISPPKFSSSLVLTTDHPLMGLGSPEDYPDVIPKKLTKDDDKELSLSSIEDERPETNGYDFYSPPMNTSKNNLYFSENFTTTDSEIDVDLPPDVARVERRKIIPKFTERNDKLTAHIDGKRDGMKYVEVRRKINGESTPKAQVYGVDIPDPEFYTGVAEWCESPSHLRSMPNFQLPIELSTNITANNDLDSPDVVSSSTQEDHSAYQALVDPYTGSVALRPTAPRSPATPRRKIQLPPEEDRCSVDSVSDAMESEEEPPELEPEGKHHSDDDSKRSHSTSTVSECSDPIPEYSAADELRDERSWVTVHSGGTTATCDMKVIEPFKRVLSHGGYDALGSAIIVFSACHLPDNARPDYRYVMDNLFLYVIWTLERLVTDEYVLIYLHGSAGGRRLPTFRWLQECYRLIDRRLRKSLKHLYLVHPTFWLKSFVLLTKPFVSSKFFRKLSYVRSLSELSARVPVEPHAIPHAVRRYDDERDTR